MTSTPNEPLDSTPETPEDDKTADSTWGTPSDVPPAGSGSDGPTPPADGPTTEDRPTDTPPLIPAAAFFDRIRGWNLVRPNDDRKIAGVAAAVAKRCGFDPVAARLAFALLTVLAGLGILLYALGWMFLPHPDGRIHAQQVLMGKITPGFLGASLILLVCLVKLIPLIVIGVPLYLLARDFFTPCKPKATA